MAFSNALAKYIGNELVSAGTKGLAKAGATSALSSLVPKVATGVATNLATKAGTDVATRAGISALDSLFPASENTIDLYRGQIKGNDNLYYNKGNGTGGSATVGNGFYMTPNEAKTEPWRGEGIEPVHLRANKNDILTRDELVEKTNWANDMLGDLDAMKNLYDNDPQQAELIEALATGHLPEVSKYLDKPFIQPDSGQGEELAETIFFPDTRPMLTNRYKEILRADAEPYVPAGIEKANIVNGRLSDANGNPVRLYHSTPYEFSEFDDSKLGQNTLADNTGYGHFATPDKEFSSRFKDIENRGVDGRTIELQARMQRPITHPYGARDKYSGEELDNIVRNYFKANGNYESLIELENEASEAGESLYDTYMSYMSSGENPYEVAKWERDDLMKAGYDGMEIVEGPRNQIVAGAKENTPVSSIIAFEGKNFRPTTHLPISSVEGEGLDIPVSGSVLNKVAKYLKSPTDANADGVNIDIRRGAGDAQRLIDTDMSLSRLQNSPARGMLGNEQIQAYKRALNGENLSDEFLKNDKFARVLDEEVSKRPLLITPEQEADPSLIDPKMLSEFEGTARKFINQNLDGVERGRKAVIVLGRPSSGKSSGAVNLYTNKKGGGFFELDNDEIKKLLPGYDDGMGANAVHNASSLISKKMVLPELADNGYNIVLPIVGKKESSVMSYVDELANRGYEIAMINTNLPVDKCRTRNRTRAYETGRNVADAYLVSVGEKPDLVYNSIKEKIKNGTERRIRSYAEVSTDVPFGEKAILVENSGGELLARLSD